MRGTIAQRLDGWARNVTPALTALLAVFLEVIPFGVPGFENVTPTLTMMALFYWLVYRPDLVPATAAFAVGLLLDILSGGPIGLHALVLLIVHGVVLTQRRFFLGKPFIFAWIGFSVIAAGAILLQWLISCLLAVQLLPIDKALAQHGLSAIIFPLVAWLLVHVHRAWVRLSDEHQQSQ